MKRKNIKYYVVAIILLIVIITLSLPFFIAEFQLNAEIEKLREEGIPVTIQEFADKYYKSVPESQNAALVFNKAFSLLPYNSHKCVYHSSEKKLFNASLENRICYKLSPEELENAKKYVEESSAFFNEMEKIKKYKFIRFAYKWEDANEMEMPELNKFRMIIKLYTMKIELAINRNNLLQADELFKEMFNITRLASQNPLCLGQISFCIYDDIALKKLERAMSALQFSSEQLKSFDNILNNHELLVAKGWHVLWKWDLVYTLCLTNFVELKKNGFFEYIRTSYTDEPEKSDTDLTVYLENIKMKFKYMLFYSSGGLANTLSDDIKILKKVIDIPLDVYINQKKILERIDDKRRQGLISNTSYLGCDLFMKLAQAIARLRCAKTACAVERFRLKYGKFPEKLKQLVPEFLNKVPVDPFDGKDIRYFRSDFDIKYEVQVKVRKKPKASEKPVPSEITDIFGSGEIPEKTKYKFVKVKKAGFQVYSVGENLKDERSSLIVEKHNSGMSFFGTRSNDDITFTVLDK